MDRPTRVAKTKSQDRYLFVALTAADAGSEKDSPASDQIYTEAEMRAKLADIGFSPAEADEEIDHAKANEIP